MKHRTLSARQVQLLILSVILAVVVYLIVSLSSEWEKVLQAYQSIGVTGILIALALSLLNYVLRFLRWQLYLNVINHRQSWREGLMIYLSGFALTTTPGKAGEMLRSVFLKSKGVSYASSTAIFFSERLSDLFAIVVLCMLGVTLFEQGIFVTSVGACLVILLQLSLSSSSLLGFIRKWVGWYGGKGAKAMAYVVTILSEAKRFHSFPVQIISLILSFIAWGAEAYAFYLILVWGGANPSYVFAFSIYAISILAGAISFLPGGLGGAEIVMVSLLLLGGIDEPQAIAATIVIRLVTLWFAVGLGCCALIYTGRPSRNAV